MSKDEEPILTLRTVEEIDSVLSRAESEEWIELFLCQSHTTHDVEFRGQAQHCRGEPARLDRCFRIECSLKWDITKVARLTHLRYVLLLGVRAVKAIKLADHLHKIPKLTSLDLTYDEMGVEGISALANNLDNVPRLASLDLGGTELSDAGAEILATSLFKVPQLTSLNLPVNDIGPVGARCLAQNLRSIPKLTFLDLGGNRIGDAGARALAEYVHAVPELTSLKLWQCEIGEVGVRALAQAWQGGHLKKLRHVELNLNPLPVSEEVQFSNSPAEIFTAILQGRELCEANIVVLGDPEAGKTWLCERLFMNRTPMGRQATHDFELHNSLWKPNLSGRQPISLKVWDFGGQHVLHSVHEMFLTHRSIPLVVVDVTKTQEENNLPYWLRTVRHLLGEMSPLIIVASKCLDDRGKQLEHLNVNELKRTHRLSGQVRIVEDFDVLSERGIANLKSQITETLRGVEELFQMVSPMQRRIKNRAEMELAKPDSRGRKRALVPRKEFATWCKSEEFLEKREVELGKRGFPFRADPDTLLRLAHDFGSLFFFGNTLSETNVITRGGKSASLFKVPASQRRWLACRKDSALHDWLIHPHWLKWPLYHITRESENVRNNGTLSEADIDKVLRNNPAQDFDVPEAERSVVKAVLLLTELCHFNEQDGTYLFPRGLLPSGEAFYPDWYDAKRNPGSELGWFFFPEAVFHRLVVRWFAKIARKRVWRFGMSVKDGDAEALVRSFPSEGRVTIDIHGGTAEAQRDLYRDLRRDLVDFIGSQPESERPFMSSPVLAIASSTTESFSWLHLTDLHYGLEGQYCLWPTLRGPFLDSLKSLHDRCGPWNAVFFTGDLVQAGKPDEFARMQREVLDPLWAELSRLGSGGAVLLAVPGNHDLVRPDANADNPAIDALLNPERFTQLREKFWSQRDGSYRRVIKEAFQNYETWWAATPHRPRGIKTGELPGEFSITLTSESRRIGVVGLNTSFLQLAGGNYQQKLVWDPRQLHAICEPGIDLWAREHDVCLLLTHQGPSWLSPEARKEGETEITPEGRFVAHLFGHQHETDLLYVSRGGGVGDAVRLCQGCSVFGMEKFGDPPKTDRAHGYAAGRIEFEGDKAYLRIWPRVATSKTGGWRFIPDHNFAKLEEDDGGTKRDPIPCRNVAGQNGRTF